MLATPAIALLLIFMVGPLLAVVALAFVQWNPLLGTGEFVGFDNFRRVLTGEELWQAAFNTCIYVLITVPATLVVALLLALGIHSLTRGQSFWRAAYFLPAASTMAAMAVVWRWMFYPEQGIIDQSFGNWLGLTGWLNSPSLALPAVAVVGSWQSIGPTLVILLAGLSGVPGHLHEAARLDGANAWTRFWHVTWPALGPSTVFAVVITSRDALRVFDQVYVMTKGGPVGSTETLAYLLWKRGIRFLDVGGGSVITLFLLVAVVGYVVIQFRLYGRQLEEAAKR